MLRAIRLGGWVRGTAVALCCWGAMAHGQTPVAHLELKQLAGQWYEVARLPNKAEKKCTANAFVLYALADKPLHFQVVTSCERQDGSKEIKNKNGKSADKSGDGKLKLAAIFPFRTKYWVLALGPQGEWALVGTPNKKTLWIYSKTATVTPELLGQLKAQASSQGFDAGRLVVSPQP